MDSKQNLDAAPPTKRQLRQTKSERNVLSEEEVAAKAAMRRTVHEMKGSLSKLVDVHRWAKEHPWMVAGSAVAIGLITGIALRPTRKESQRDSRQVSAAASQLNHERHDAAKQGKSFLASTFGTVLTGLLSILAQGLLSSAVNARDQDNPQSSNGATGGAECDTEKE